MTARGPAASDVTQLSCPTWLEAVRRALPAAAPVMVAYLSIGLPAGVLASMVGVTPGFAVVVSMTYYSGAGQFMVPRLLLAGQPLVAIAITVSFTNMRQMLYSAALSPYFAGVGRMLSLVFAATVTDESFGVNLERFEHDVTWDARTATVTNLCCMLSWSLANLLGCALGPVLDLPTALMSFAMTSIFICLAVMQPMSRTTALVMAVAAASVFALKLCGLDAAAILVGAVCGVVAGVVADGLVADVGGG